MKIKGTKGMTIFQIQEEVTNGGRFVQFSYCFSIIVASFRQSSPVYLIKNGESAFLKSLPFSAISLLLGWWGIPWGVIYTVGCLYINAAGGKDVTAVVMRQFHKQTDGYVFEFEKNSTRVLQAKQNNVKTAL